MNGASLSSGPVSNEAQTGSLAPSEGAARHDDTRLRLLDNIWLLTLLSLLFVTTLTWFTGALDINFSAVAGGLLGLGAIHLAFAVRVMVGYSARWLPSTCLGFSSSVLSGSKLGVCRILCFFWRSFCQ